MPLQLERTDLRFAGAHHVKSNQPFVQGNVRVLHDGVDRHREAFSTIGALVQPGSDFILRVWCHLVNTISVGISAMRADRAMRPSQILKICAGFFLSGKVRHHLHQGQFARLFVVFHVNNLAHEVGIVKCIIP